MSCVNINWNYVWRSKIFCQHVQKKKRKWKKTNQNDTWYQLAKLISEILFYKTETSKKDIEQIKIKINKDDTRNIKKGRQMKSKIHGNERWKKVKFHLKIY